MFWFLKVRYQSQQSWWLVYLNQESGRVCRELVDVSYADGRGMLLMPQKVIGALGLPRGHSEVRAAAKLSSHRDRAAVWMI